MKKEIEFRNKDMELVKVTIEFRKIDKEYTNKDTLEKYHCDLELSFVGEDSGGMGQIADRINPRTESQKELIELWERYHLNGMSAGTAKQNDAIEKWRSGDYSYVSTNHDVQQSFLAQYKYYVSVGELPNKYDENIFILKASGLYIDRGYRYGYAWLHEPLPEDIEEIIDDLLEKIEEEEDELSEELDAVFDMGSADFEPTAEIISKVMELRDCDETEAVRFIALGMFLECTFGDLNYDFDEVSENCYSAMRRWYYVGTDDELEEIAKEMLDNDSEYLEWWKSSVADGNCLDSFEDWKEEILRHDGWVSILNRYDGNHREYNIDGEYICVSRS